jgi:hypothetical protein
LLNSYSLWAISRQGGGKRWWSKGVTLGNKNGPCVFYSFQTNQTYSQNSKNYFETHIQKMRKFYKAPHLKLYWGFPNINLKSKINVRWSKKKNLWTSASTYLIGHIQNLISTLYIRLDNYHNQLCIDNAPTTSIPSQESTLDHCPNS